MIPNNLRIEDAALKPIAEKVFSGERLTFDDGLSLFRSNDLLAIGYLAHYIRQKLHGSRTYFNVNRHINPTNVCVEVAVFARLDVKQALLAPIPCRWKRLFAEPVKAGQKQSQNSTLSGDFILIYRLIIM